MMQVLHINSNYLTSKLHENLLDRIENEQIHNTVFMPIKKETKEDFLYESKYEVYSPVTFNNIDKYIFTYKQRKIYNKLQETIDVSEKDVTHAHTLFTDGNIAYQLYQDYGIPYVVTVRGFTDIDNFFTKRINLRKRGRKILENASQVVFLSETNRKKLLEKFIHDNQLKNDILYKSQIIPNGIDGYYFENKGKPKTLDQSQPLKFVQVGQVQERKNGLGSIRGIKRYMEKTGNSAELLFVGKVAEESYAKQLREEGQGFVEYHPPVDIVELTEIYQKNDIFIMPSFSETFGLVYPEAMSQGLPVIYTKGQGFDGQYEDGLVGYPVEEDNPDDVAEKIDMILNNYEEISSNALEVYDKFNWDVLSEEYIKMYIQVKK